MTNEYRAQPRFVIEVGFERKNAEHEIEKARHFLDASAIPGPDLRADVINYFLLPCLHSQCARQAQIEPRIIDQHNGVGLALLNFLQRFAKLLPKITVLLDHFPQAKDGRITEPIFESFTGDTTHFRTATPDEIDLAIAGQ